MANFILQVPNNVLKSFAVSASSNGGHAHPTSSTSEGGVAGPVIVELPLDRIRRPLMRTRANDPIKVKQLMDSISEIGLQVPIDVLEVDGVYYDGKEEINKMGIFRLSSIRGSPASWPSNNPLQSSTRNKRNFKAPPSVKQALSLPSSNHLAG